MDYALELLASIKKPQKTRLVIGCSNCRNVLSVREGQRHRGCPYCGNKIRVDRAHVFLRSSDSSVIRARLAEIRRGF